MSLGIEVDRLDRVPDLLARGHVAVLRGVELSVDEQVAFTAGLGTLVADEEGRPQVRYEDDRTSGERRSHNEMWHADLSWSAEGPAITVLHALEAGRLAAPTTVVDTVSGYSRLTDSERSAIRTWSARHHVARSRAGREESSRRRVRRARSVVSTPPGPAWRDDVRQPTYVPEPGAAHPVVVAHPGTGRPGVMLGDHAWTLVDRSDAEGRRLVDRLHERLVELGDRHTHRWRAGDLLVFDNRTTLHRREPGRRWPSTRVLRRTVAWPAAGR